jgi:CrcB protein
MREIAAVLAGGILGTGLRLLADLLLPHDGAGFPLSTLLVNIAGAFVLGLLVSLLWHRVPAWLRAGLGAGLIGSFTTFSAVMVSLVDEGSRGLWALAGGYLALSLVLGLAAAALGLWLGGRRPAPLEPIDWVDE